MKKIISILMLVAMCVVMFAACNSALKPMATPTIPLMPTPTPRASAQIQVSPNPGEVVPDMTPDNSALVSPGVSPGTGTDTTPGVSAGTGTETTHNTSFENIAKKVSGVSDVAVAMSGKNVIIAVKTTSGKALTSDEEKKLRDEIAKDTSLKDYTVRIVSNGTGLTDVRGFKTPIEAAEFETYWKELK